MKNNSSAFPIAIIILLFVGLIYCSWLVAYNKQKCILLGYDTMKLYENNMYCIKRANDTTSMALVDTLPIQ